MNNQEKTNGMPFHQNDELGCPNCGGKDLSTATTEDSFTYGTGNDAVTLKVNVPLRTCRDCKFQFLDAAAEDAHHEAVCTHLGVLTPAEVQHLRHSYQMSRAAFAQITKLGEASIARWERGELIQNAAYDQLLYLLTFKENMHRLEDRTADAARLPTVREAAPTRFRVFVPTDADREAATAFDLRRRRRGA